MSISLANVNAREWITKTREGVKPWTEFFNFNAIFAHFRIVQVRDFVILKTWYEFMKSLAFIADGFHACFTPVCSRHKFLFSLAELAQFLVGVLIRQHAYN